MPCRARTWPAALGDVRAALELSPAHISHYQLTLEPGTLFGGRPPPGLPNDELGFRMQEHCQATLAAADFLQYEVSAYARPGAQCAHNLNYGTSVITWALAPARTASSRTARADITRASASATAALPGARLARRAGDEHRGERPDLPFEFMMNALRLNQGFVAGAVRSAPRGLAWAEIVPRVQRLPARIVDPARPGRWRPRSLEGDFSTI